MTGRKITGKLILDEPNRFGRITCKVDVRRPAAWTDEHTAAALRVASHWFRDIGGIGLLAHRQLCHVVPRLAAGQEERCMHWAIDAYATAKWHVDNKAWKPIGDFFQGTAYDVWLEKSDGYQKFLEEQKIQIAAREGARRKGADLVDCSEVYLRTQLELAEADVSANDRLRRQAGQRAFDSWPDRQQFAYLKKCAFERNCDSWPLDEFDLVYFGGTIEGFMLYVYSRALHDESLRQGVAEHVLTGHSPRTTHGVADLRAELSRRGLLDPSASSADHLGDLAALAVRSPNPLTAGAVLCP